MSSQPLSLFRSSWLTALGGMSAVMLLLTLLSLSQAIGNHVLSSWEAIDWLEWAVSKLQSLAIGSMIVMTIPWMLLSFFGEFLYTRPLTRREWFKSVFGEYLKFWTGGMILLTCLIGYSQISHYRTSSTMPWELGLIAGSLSIGGSLLLAAPGGVLRKLALPAALLVGWLLTLGDWVPANLHVGAGVSWALWLFLVWRAFALVSKQDADLSLDRDGSEENDLSALMRAGLFRLFGNQGPNVIKRRNGGLAGRLRLLLEYPRMLYMQMVLLIGGTLLGTSLLLARYPLEMSRNAFLPFQLGVVVISLIVGWGTVLITNPRFLLAKRWEFLASRPIDPRQAYLAAWLLQGGILLALAALGLTIISFEGEVGAWLDPARIGSLLLFLWCGGELAVGVFTLLLGASLTLSPAVIVGLLATLHTPQWPGLLMWAGVLGFRIWDMFRFGALWQPERTPMLALKRQALHYAVPGVLLLGLSLSSSQVQPLPRFLSLEESRSGLDAAERMQLGLSVLAALYSRYDGPSVEEVEAIRPYQFYSPGIVRRLIEHPGEADAPQQMAQMLLQNALIPAHAPWYGYTLSRYGYIDRQSSLWQEVHGNVLSARFWIEQAEQSQGVEPAKSKFLHSQLAELEQDYAKALQLAEQAAAAEPQNPVYAFQRVRLLKLMLRQAPALEAYQELATRFPAHAAKAWTLAGTLLEEAGRYREAVASYARASAVAKDEVDRSVLRFRLLRLPYYRFGLCAGLGELARYDWVASINAIHEEKLLCDNQPEASRRIPGKGAWYLLHGQPQKAAEVLDTQDTQPLRAEALLQAGDRPGALAIARYRALPWSIDGSGQAFLGWALRTDEQLVYHRLLLQLEANPAIDSGLHVLLRTGDPQREWPLLQKAYAGRDAELGRLTSLKQALARLDAAMTAAGQLDAATSRSLAKTRVQLMLSVYLPPAQKLPELQQAVKLLRKEIMGG